MRVTDLPTYQSPWLVATDLQGKPRRLTIIEWTIKEVNQRDAGRVEKVALSFAGAKKKLLLNATQAKVLDAAFGELERWIGKQIILQPARTPQGQQTIEVVILQAAPAAASTEAPGDGKNSSDNPFDDDESEQP